MKRLLLLFLIFSIFNVHAQEKTLIQGKVPNKDDVVYIAGNQRSLGDWDYDKVKMYKVSDFYRMVALNLDYPAEFKFTRGSLDTEGIHKTLKDNPNLVLNDTLSKVAYRIIGWKDEMLKSQLNIGYQYLPFQSKIMDEERTVKIYLPKNYLESMRYPVIYLTDANAKKFKIVTSTLESLSTAPYNAIPECILVGIPQEKMQMELNTNLEASADKFKNFILTELVNLIDLKFKTSGFNAIIGHDMGADFNQMLMMSKNNPIKGYINISPVLKDGLKKELKNYFKNYEGRRIFYHLSNGYFGSPEAKDSFEFIKSINGNDDIDFSYQELKLGKESLFSATIKDGLIHIFKDYRNLNNYSNFKEYAKNYPSDMVLTYRILAGFDPSDIDYYTSKIIHEKDVDMYTYMIDYLEKRSSAGEDKSYTSIDKAIHYRKMEMYDSSLVYWNKALKSYSNNNSNVVNPENFYMNFTDAIDTYLHKDYTIEGMQFLEKCTIALPQYALAFHYYIAKISSEKKVNETKGKESLLYCVEKFKPNIYFTKNDLKDLVYSFDN